MSFNISILMMLLLMGLLEGYICRADKSQFNPISAFISESAYDSNSAISRSDENISRQIIQAFCISGQNKGFLICKQLIDGLWVQPFDTIQCSFGFNGVSCLETKKEGDLRTPSGTFELGSAFGYSKDIQTDMDFIVLKDNHYWVCDPNSQSYNMLIEYSPKTGCAEKMKRNDHLYKYGIIIEYNFDPVIKAKGSAIFIHVERQPGSPTTGCIAISEQNVKALIQWIKPNLNPTIVIDSEL